MMRQAATVFLVAVAMFLCLPAIAFALDFAPLIGGDGVQRIAVFIAVGLVGMFAHWWKKWLRGELGANLWDYLVVEHPRYTALAVTVFVSGALGLWVSGQLASMDLGPLLLSAATAGYTCDSALNKSGDL